MELTQSYAEPIRPEAGYAVTRRPKAPAKGEAVSDDLRMIFAQNLKAARQEADLSLVALSELTGISRRYLSLAERGVANVTLDVVTTIAKPLRRTPTEMLTPSPKPPRPARSR